MTKLKADINFLPQADYDKVVSFIHDHYPTDKYEIGYAHSPFVMGYAVAFSLIIKNGGLENALMTEHPKKIYQLIENAFPQYEFDEIVDEAQLRKLPIGGYNYPQYDKLFNFLVANDYDFPKERIARYSQNVNENPLLVERYYYKYNIDGSLAPRVKKEDENEVSSHMSDEDKLNLFNAFYNE